MSSNETYVKEHKLKQLMEFLMEQLVSKKPKNPEKYLITLLERRQRLLNERPKTVRINNIKKLHCYYNIQPKKPTESLSPRSRIYEKPWLKNSTSSSLHSSMPKPARTSRPKTPNMSKTVDLTVRSREASRDIKKQLKKVEHDPVVVKEAKMTTMKVVNSSKIHGIPSSQGKIFFI